MATSKEKLQIIVDAQGIAKTKAQLKGMDSATGGATKSFGAMAAGIAGATVALYALGKATSFAIRTGKDFEQGMANVKAISGATGAEFKALEANARKLGASTKFTATEVSGLQTEFSKLGFTATEINKVTKGTLALAAATGSDLAVSAEVAGATLRGFGLDASETGKVTDVMAKSFSSSALDMSKFAESMKFVAPVAKMAGFQIEGTTAILGQLANAGLHGSMAGTALRSIFLKLADTNSSLSKRLGGSVNSVEELIPALNKLKNEGVDLTQMLELTDKRAVTAFGVLLDGSDDVNILAESFRNAGGSAQRMADIQLDTLEGKLTILNSAMEGLGIAVFDLFKEDFKKATEGITTLIQSWTIDLQLHQTAIDLTSAKYKALGIETKKSALEARMAILEQAIELEKHPSLLTRVFDTWFEGTKKVAKATVNNLLPGLLTATEALNNAAESSGLYDNMLNEITGSSNKLSVDQERLNQLLKEQKNLQEELNRLGEGKIIATGDGEFQGPPLPPDLTPEAIGATEEQRIKSLDLLQQYQFATLDIKEQAAIQELESLKATKEQILAVEKFYDQQRWKSALNTTGKLLGAMGQLNSASKGSALVTARLQQGAIIANTASAAMAAITPPTGAPTPLGYANMAAVIMTGIAQGVQIEKGLSQIQGAQTGMDEVVTQPTLIMAGEGGKAEHIGITPLEGPNIDGPQGGGSITVNVSGNVMTEEFTVDQVIPAIREALRRGENLDHKHATTMYGGMSSDPVWE